MDDIEPLTLVLLAFNKLQKENEEFKRQMLESKLLSEMKINLLKKRNENLLAKTKSLQEDIQNSNIPPVSSSECPQCAQYLSYAVAPNYSYPHNAPFIQQQECLAEDFQDGRYVRYDKMDIDAAIDFPSDSEDQQ